MKRAVILHGTNGSPEGNWFPWLKTELEQRDYDVWVPALPGNDRPNRETYNNFLFDASWDFTDNLVIGHSSGAVSVLNLLADERCPAIRAAIMVSAWHDSEKATLRYGGLSPEIFKNLFPQTGFDFSVIQKKVNKGEFPNFLPETAEIRRKDWTVAPIPADLQDRRVEITGPVDRKMIINAMNSGANVFMADFEDSNTPTWSNNIEGQVNLRDAVKKTLEPWRLPIVHCVHIGADVDIYVSRAVIHRVASC